MLPLKTKNTQKNENRKLGLLRPIAQAQGSVIRFGVFFFFCFLFFFFCFCLFFVFLFLFLFFCFFLTSFDHYIGEKTEAICDKT